jgi:LmbE family N-acetylglucosaminyl deacetylase
MATVSPPRIHGDGVSEQAWRQCHWLARLPVRPCQALLDASRLVVVSPHPDDEVLGCGGLIAHARRQGLPVLVVSVSQGEQCYPGDPRWPPQRLSALRPRELAEALAVLGVPGDAIVELRIPDGGIAAHEAELAERLASLVGPRDRVLATWRHDGHPDHEASARAARAAAFARGAASSEYPVWAWHWLPPEAEDAPLPAAARYVMDEPAWSAKQAALACFRSQRGGAPYHIEAPILPPRVLARFQRHFEVFCHEHA